MKMRGDKCHSGRGKRVKISLLPNNVGKKSVNDAGPRNGHNREESDFKNKSPILQLNLCSSLARFLNNFFA